MKSWDQQNYLVIRGFCYIRPLYNEVPLYHLNLTLPPPPYMYITPYPDNSPPEQFPTVWLLVLMSDFMR